MDPLNTPFLRGFIQMIDDAVCMGWHEANGGNLSYRLSTEELEPLFESFELGSWQDLGVVVPGIAEEAFVITAAGSHFKNMSRDPKSNLGIIQLDETGSRYRICWGFAKGARPTSELFMHMLNHEVIQLSSQGANRVIYHAHPVNVNALTFVLPLTSAALTRELWSTISECALIFPKGVGVIEWMLPGSMEIAVASADELKIHDAVVWPHHGILCAGNSFDHAFGIISTIEKASEIAVKVRSMHSEARSGITEDQIRALDEEYGLGIDHDFLAEVFQ